MDHELRKEVELINEKKKKKKKKEKNVYYAGAREVYVLIVTYSN